MAKMTVAELNNKVEGIDNRLAKLEETNEQILSLLEKFTAPQQTSTPVESRKAPAPVSDSKVREFEGKDGKHFWQKGKITVYETEYRGRTVYTVCPSKVTITKDGEKITFAPKENRQAVKDFCKGKKLTDLTFTNDKGRKVVYQRPLYKSAQECLAAIQ